MSTEKEYLKVIEQDKGSGSSLLLSGSNCSEKARPSLKCIAPMRDALRSINTQLEVL
jgi:hypothetical protein